MRSRFVFEVIRRMFVGEFMHVPGGERGVGIVIYYVTYALYAYAFLRGRMRMSGAQKSKFIAATLALRFA